VCQLLTTLVLDREVTSSYQLMVTCYDGPSTSSASLSGSAPLHVYVDDLNDNAPLFRSRVYVARVTENQPIGTTVTVVEAIDADEGRNAEVRYQLMPAGSRDFRLDATSGLLTTKRQFDRERQETVNISVVSMDAGRPAMSASVDVIVFILDANDEVLHTTHCV